jgi:hypothetical protein
MYINEYHRIEINFSPKEIEMLIMILKTAYEVGGQEALDHDENTFVEEILMKYSNMESEQ